MLFFNSLILLILLLYKSIYQQNQLFQPTAK